MATPKKQEGSTTGLRFSRQLSFGVSDPDAIWTKLEPNSYSSFGAEVTKVARNPIVDDEQTPKGVLSDLNAGASLNCDLTPSPNVMALFEGFLWRAAIEKPTTKPRNGTQIPFTAIDGAAEQFEAASGLDGIGLVERHLIVAYNLAAAANNGLHRVTAVAAGAVTVATDLTADGAPAASAYFEAVGYHFAAGTVSVTKSGNLTTLTRASGSVAFNAIGISVGDWLFLGGDTLDSRFANQDADDVYVNQGWVRVGAISTTTISLDETEHDMTAETGAAVAATSVMTLGSNPADGAQFTIGATTYTLQASLVDSANNILIGATASDTCDNIVAALNAGAGAGTLYGTGTTANASVSGLAGAGDTVDLTADTPGAAGNSVVTTDTSGAISFTGATLSGGADAIALQVFFGHRITNPNGASTRTRFVQELERSMGPDDDEAPTDYQYEYVEGALCNEFSVNVPGQDKVTCDFAWVAKDRTGSTSEEGPKAGTRPSLGSYPAFGTSGDVKRIKMALIDDETSHPDELFEFLAECKITGNNNVKPNKAVTVLGAFDASKGNLQVTGTASAYFTTNAALNAIRANSTGYFNMQMVVEGKGLVFDVPRLTFGGGPPDVKINEPIMLPLTFEAHNDADKDYKLAIFEFNYLPELAAA